MTAPAASRRSERARELAFEVWGAIGVLLLIAAGGWLLSKIATALVPFIVALVIVVLLRAPVAWLVERRVPRGLAVTLCYLAALLVTGGAMLFIIPVLLQQVGDFVTALPDYIDRAYSLWQQVTEPKGTPVVPQWVTDVVLNIKDTTVDSLGRWSAEGLSFAAAAAGQAVSGLINTVLAAIIGFYTLLDLPKLHEETLSLVPRRYRDEALTITSTVSRVVGGWMRAALIDALVVGALIAIGLTIAGVPYAVAIGILGGLLNVVPYLGPVIAALLAGLAGIFVSPWAALWGAAVIVIVQQFDSLWLNPRIMSENVDLHPVLVVFSLLVGATVFGVAGMLLAVPVAAILKGLFVYFYERRTRRSLRTEDGALFKSPKPPKCDESDEAAEDCSDDGDDEDRDA